MITHTHTHTHTHARTGGVFGNKKKWIIEAIAQCQALIVSSGLDVTLMIYSADDLNELQWAALRTLTQRMNGRVQMLD